MKFFIKINNKGKLVETLTTNVEVAGYIDVSKDQLRNLIGTMPNTLYFDNEAKCLKRKKEVFLALDKNNILSNNEDYAVLTVNGADPVRPVEIKIGTEITNVPMGEVVHITAQAPSLIRIESVDSEFFSNRIYLVAG